MRELTSVSVYTITVVEERTSLSDYFCWVVSKDTSKAELTLPMWEVWAIAILVFEKSEVVFIVAVFTPSVI